MYLGLDFGTSGARACVISKTEAIIHQDSVIYPEPENQTPLDWREGLHMLLRWLPAAITAEIQAVAIAATSASVMLCDKTLEPTSQAVLYFDERAHEEAAQLKHIAPPDHIACNATSGLAKFLWLTRHTDLSCSRYFLHQADWLAAQLTGLGGISDYHNALKSGYDVERLDWPDWVLNLPHAHLLPRVLHPATRLRLSVRP